MLKIGVLVSGGGTNLQALIDAEKSGIIKNGKISLVLSSSSEAYALKRAEQNDIKSVVLPRKNFKDNLQYSDSVLEILRDEKIDLVVLAGFMTVLKGNLLKEYNNRIINVHPALIPSFCGDGFYGMKVHEKALEYGVKVSGATVHFVNEVTDGGAIIMQKAVEVDEGITAPELQKKIMEQAEWIILPRAVELFCAGKIKVDGRRTIILK